MSLNVIDLIKGQLGPALVSQAASQLGESESGVSKAISGLLPAVVGGLANNANKPGVLDAITGAASSGLLSNLLGGSSNNSVISSVLSAIFGDKVGGLVNAISSFSGVSNSSSNSLLNMVTGAALGSLGKYSADNNLDASGITRLLEDQKGLVSSLLPAGLSLASLGLGNWFGGDKVETEKVKVTSYDEPKVEVNRGGATHVNVDRNDDNGGGGSIWKWLLPLLLLGLAAWFLWKQCNKPAETTTGVTDSTIVVSDSSAAVYVDSTGTTLIATKQSTIVTLPTGKTLNAYKGGIEDQVVAFLNSDEYKNADEAALKNKWFNFDNLNFEFGTTKLTPESQVQLDNLKAILAAYPDAKVKIGAYTDKKGDDAANLKLSADRANAVKAALGSAQVVEAEGYGEKFATVAETGTDKEREADRKTAIRFVK
ncbi:OmpA family protein [uncultured Chryseobacterium sp.]|uniref:OmpA family protein n=1 Tax=uncultured Chryseobacterium sp. TaxID=259322 RepID=UPI00262EF2DE|nr:OmpA family protein [uncultured Chryseobacterium sp.]